MAPLMQRMARRGPDDEGTWTDDRHCALGFRRLSILDLSPAGHQPMVTREGTHVLVFNGEIYNFREIRSELAKLGHEPRSGGDAEVLLLALRQWGIGALDRINGMFAFAFYDVRERRLLLARDHVGIKPLYVARSRKGVVFGSQYDQLLAHPWFADAPVDPGGLGLYLRLGFLPAPYGLHAGLGQLDAGQWLEVTPTAQRTGRFFELARRPQVTLRGDAALDAFEDSFSRAVKRQLIADVPVGVFLSGGIDSPLVAAEAARQSGERLHAFTIGVEDSTLDETADARTFAGEIGLEHVSERVSMTDAVSLLDDVVSASTEPTADYSMFPTLLVSRLARRQVKVALSGDGGDELYWGYPKRFGSAIELAPYFRLPRRARYLAVGARKLLGRGHATRDVVQYDTIGRLYQRKHTLMPERDLEALFPTLAPVPAAFDAFQCDATDPDAVAQWTRWNELKVHLARVLAKVDRASMYNSLEVRVPLLDREVIEVAWRTDWRTCFDPATRTGKRVLRRALSKRVHHQTHAKRGFTVPIADWLVGSLANHVRELLLDRDAILGVPVDRAHMALLVNRLRGGDHSIAWGMWLLLSLSLWERRFGRAS